MSDAEMVERAKAAFKAFDALVVNEGIDITLSQTWKQDKALMKQICMLYIDGQRLGGCDTHELNKSYTIIKRIAYADKLQGLP